eukprot:gene25018-30220_t
MPTAGTSAATNTNRVFDGSGTGTTPPPLSVFPNVLKFGVISSGFFYHLRFQIKNNTLDPMRVKVFCTPAHKERNMIRLVSLPDIAAPGMTVTITLELTTEHAGMSMFHLKVAQNLNDYVCEKDILAHIVTQETFKYVKKSLQIQKRPIHEHNVEAAGPMIANVSMNTPITSMSEALIMDDEDIDDLLDLPTAPNVFWDPFAKCLRIDPLLGQVIVDPSLSLAECLAQTSEARQSRVTELEEQGFLTVDAIDRIRQDRDKSGYKDPYAGITGFGSFDEGDEEEEEEEDLPAELPPADDPNQASQASYRSVVSISSLLALKRDRIEQQRRATISASSNFAKDSRNDSMVDSMRTLSVIQNKNKTVQLPSHKV